MWNFSWYKNSESDGEIHLVQIITRNDNNNSNKNNNKNNNNSKQNQRDKFILWGK